MPAAGADEEGGEFTVFAGSVDFAVSGVGEAVGEEGGRGGKFVLVQRRTRVGGEGEVAGRVLATQSKDDVQSISPACGHQIGSDPDCAPNSFSAASLSRDRLLGRQAALCLVLT